METVAIPLTPATIGLAIAFLGNITALVWGASNLATQLKSLTLSVNKLSTYAESLEKKQFEHSARLTMLEKEMSDSLRRVEKQLDRLEKFRG